jgi:hypothetical protein
MFVFVNGFMKSSDACSGAVGRARSAPAVIAALGTPIKEGLFVSGRISVSGPSGSAELAIPIAGPKGGGTVYVAATRLLGEWHFSGLVVQIAKTKERIDLSEKKKQGNQAPLLTPSAISPPSAPKVTANFNQTGENQ